MSKRFKWLFGVVLLVLFGAPQAAQACVGCGPVETFRDTIADSSADRDDVREARADLIDEIRDARDELDEAAHELAEQSPSAVEAQRVIANAHHRNLFEANQAIFQVQRESFWPILQRKQGGILYDRAKADYRSADTALTFLLDDL